MTPQGLVIVARQILWADACNTGAPRPRPWSRNYSRTWSRAWSRAWWGVLFLLGQTAEAQIVADPGAAPGQRPVVLRTGNGVAQVEVTSPSAAGVSRNRFSQFDVPASGVILNNSRVDTTTRLGGWIRGNPGLANGSARLILSEVNARNPSQLRGYLEVAGTRAEVVVANPAGVVVDGGGFINASRAVLSTGTPVFGAEGGLTGLRVREGRVTVQGAGLDASTADVTAILARSMVLQGGLWAQELRLALGPQAVDLASWRVLPQAADPAAAAGAADPATAAGTASGARPAESPIWALDVGALGGMYAGRIFLVASEAGVGVRNAGGIHALSGPLHIDTAGLVLNAETGMLSARQDLRLAGDLRNSGTLDAGGHLRITAPEAIVNTGSLVGAEVTLAAGERITNQGPGALIGATDPSGSLSLLAPVIENLDDSTRTDTAPTTTLFGLGRVLLAGGQDAQGLLRPAQSIVNRSGLIESGGDLQVLADSLTNARSAFRVSSGYEGTPTAAELDAAGIRLSGRVGQANTPDPAQIGGIYLEPPHGGAFNSDYLYTDYQGVATMNTVTAISPRARLVAGGDLDLSSLRLLRNELSDISAGGSIALGSAWVEQDSGPGSPSLLIRVDYAGHYQYRTYKGLAWSEPFSHDIRYYPQSHGYGASLTAHAAIRGSGGALVNGPAGASPGRSGAAPAPELPAPVPVTDGSPWAPPAEAPAPAPVTPVTPAPGPAFVAPVAAPSPPPPPLPASPLFRETGDPQTGVLMETDPRFTRARQWISSAHLLESLGLDPAQAPRRLGDGLYEQRLLREQLVALTGSRLLADFADEDTQYRALLDSAVTQARAVGLVPGVALSAEQVARLTSDIVWLVAQDLTLADGRQLRVLVPQLYLASPSARLRPGGALVAAATLDLRDQQEVRNAGHLIASGDLRLESRQDLDNRLGTMLAGGTLDLSAAADIDLAGALLRADRLQANAGRDLLVAGITDNQTSASPGRSRTATTLARQADVEVAGDASLRSGRDVLVRGSRLAVGGDLAADVGRDLVVDAVQTSATSAGQRLAGEARSEIVRHQGSQLQVAGDTQARVGGDLRVQGSEVRLGAHADSLAVVDVQGAVSVRATRDRTEVDSRYQDGSASGQLHQSDETRQGARLESAGALHLRAGTDLTVEGSRIEVAGAAQLEAGGSLRVVAAEEQRERQARDAGSQQVGLGTRSTRTEETQALTLRRASAIGARSLHLRAGEAVEVRGSQVLADQDLSVEAGGDIRIEAAQRGERTSRFKEEGRSGLFGSGKGVTLGRRSQSEAETLARNEAQASTVGSVGGSLHLRAGAAYRQTGSDLIASRGNVEVQARQVSLTEARETVERQSEQHLQQSGLSVGVSSPLAAGLQSAQRSLDAVAHTTDDRLRALGRASAALQVYGAYADATGPDATTPSVGRIVDSLSLDIRLGRQRADAAQTSRQELSRGSSVQAGGRLEIAAVGDAAVGDTTESHLQARGARLEAGGDMALLADGDITLAAARNQASERSDFRTSAASVGLSVSATGNLSATASASRSLGASEGEDLAWANTEARAGGRLFFSAGGDASLVGASARGKAVDAVIGGNLHIESLQDLSRFDSHARSAGFSLSVPIAGTGVGAPGLPGGGAAGSGAGAAAWRIGRNQSQAQGRSASVSAQSGLFAGTGGFGIDVQGDTALQGGALASEADATRNHLTTASLRTGDLRHTATASASSRGLSLSGDLVSQGRYGVVKGLVGNAVDGGAASASSEGETRAVISPGTVRITDDARQVARTGLTTAEALAAVSREADGAQQPATRLDPRALLAQVRAAQTLRNEAVRTFTQFTDPAWRVMFKEPPQFYRVTCPTGADCTRHPELAQRERMTGTPEQVRAEIAQAPAGAILAVNGIQNSAERAAVLAMQNAAPQPGGGKPEIIFLMHYLPSGNAITELMVAGYERVLSDPLGATNPTRAYAQALDARGDRETVSLGHSRGTLVQANALGLLARAGVQGRDIAVQGLGGPLPASTYLQAAEPVVDPVKAGRSAFFYFANDPVAVIAGGNPGVLRLSDLLRMFTASNSAHSCYGTGAAGCQQVQYLVPNPPPGAVQDNSSLVRVTPSTIANWRKP